MSERALATRLARIANVGAARADIAARGLNVDLVEDSAIGDDNTIFHAVAIP